MSRENQKAVRADVNNTSVQARHEAQVGVARETMGNTKGRLDGIQREGKLMGLKSKNKESGERIERTRARYLVVTPQT
jgi:hypothetical protein